MSGFVERIVEHWLTSSDERGYQKAFASCLLRQQHAVKYVSPHGPLEHGKDIVSVAPGGALYAYQLKAGKVSKSIWRDIRQEMLDAAIVPVDVPGVKRRRADRVFLVLTGTLSDPVKDEIGLLNDDNRERGYPEIEVIELPELVALLSSTFDSFFPSSLGPPSDLIRLFLRDGDGPQDKATFISILKSIFEDGYRKGTIKNRLASGVIAAQLAASPYRQRENHIAELDTWILTASSILLVAKQKNLARKYWRLPFDLCWQAIAAASVRLREEALSRDDLLEGRDPFIDAYFLPFRRTLVQGYVGAAINASAILGENVKEEAARFEQFVIRERPVALWGEAAWNLVMNAVVALRHTPHGELLGEELLAVWLQSICPKPVQEYFDPYWTLEDALRLQREDDEKKEKLLISYSAASATDLLVRRLRRRRVASLWPLTSRYDQARLAASNTWSQLDWLIEDAQVEMRRLPLRGSWSAMLENAMRQRSTLFDDYTAKLLPFFLCTYTHRVDASLSGELDYRTSPEPLRREWDSAGQSNSA